MRLLLRSSGLILVAGLAAAAFLGAFPADVIEASVAPSASEDAARADFAPLPMTNSLARRDLLDRSPFVQGRTAFDRQTALAPPAPLMDVRLTGIVKVGKELRANLRINGQSISVKRGDQTPAGLIAKIEPSAVEIEGAIPQRLEMFKQ